MLGLGSWLLIEAVQVQCPDEAHTPCEDRGSFFPCYLTSKLIFVELDSFSDALLVRLGAAVRECQRDRGELLLKLREPDAFSFRDAKAALSYWAGGGRLWEGWCSVVESMGLPPRIVSEGGLGHEWG